MPRKILERAPAKVNLALSVGPSVTAGGLHPICSSMVTVDLCDELHLERLEDDRFSRYALSWHEEARHPSDIDWPITSDLAVRAHRAIEQAAGRSLPIQARIDKRVPIGGGLGGGSADAAAMLRGVNALFDLGQSAEDLAAIGAHLGSDIPFAVHGGAAIVEGTGDAVTPSDLPEVQLALIMPAYPCPTGEVYDALDEEGTTGLEADRVRSGERFNDLTSAACRVVQSLGHDMQAVSDIAEAEVHLSGSGSAMFVVCDGTVHAETLAAAIEERTDLAAIAARTCRPGEIPCEG